MGGGQRADAQNVALKTNLFYDATSTINLGIEFGIAPKWTFDLSANYNGWDFKDNKKWKQLLFQPEFRFWTCDRFNGHFLGAHLIGGLYNLGNLDMNFKFLGTDYSRFSNHRYEGWLVGVGIAYGYHLMLSKHLSFEFEVGFGYAYCRGDKYQPQPCGDLLGKNIKHHYFGPTKLAINFVYVFGKK